MNYYKFPLILFISVPELIWLYIAFWFTEDEIEEKSGTDKVGTSNSKENTTSVVNGKPDTQANTDGNTNGTTEHSRKRPRQLLTEKVAQEKKMEIEKEIKAARKKKPKNLLFTTGYSSEESLDDNSEDEVET